MQSSSPKFNFNLPKNTRLGALILLGILLLLVLVWRLLPTLITPQNDPEEAALQQAWTKFEKENVKEHLSDEHTQYTPKDDDNTNASPNRGALFAFDPNTATEAELLRLGLPKYTVNTILKYRAKSITTFKRKEDLQRLYTLSKQDYERIAPYVVIPENTVGQNSEGHKEAAFIKEEASPKIIELNSASAEELMSLKGIGPGYSKRIIHFRDALGGFFSVDQLREVYGFPDSTFQQLKDKFSVNVTLVKQINVNIADEAMLAKMPYIGRKMAPYIIKLRDNLGSFKEIEQLRQVPLINEEKYRKIAPYLSTH